MTAVLHRGDRAAFRAGDVFIVGNVTGRAGDGTASTYDLVGDGGELVVGAAAADVTAAPAYEPRIDDQVTAPGQVVGRVVALDRPGRIGRRAYVRTPDGRTRSIVVDALRPAAQLNAR